MSKRQKLKKRLVPRRPIIVGILVGAVTAIVLGFITYAEMCGTVPDEGFEDYLFWGSLKGNAFTAAVLIGLALIGWLYTLRTGKVVNQLLWYVVNVVLCGSSAWFGAVFYSFMQLLRPLFVRAPDIAALAR
jgi:RsiW-degrading membrane proteinase PrsW (M82 family)